MSFDSDLDLQALMDGIGADAYQLVGSQYILGVGKDWDYLAKVMGFHEAAITLRAAGFEAESEQYLDRDAQFMSFRRGDLNILITTDAEFFRTFCLSTEACKYLANLRPGRTVADRSVRVALHAIIRDGKDWDGVPEVS